MSNPKRGVQSRDRLVLTVAQRTDVGRKRQHNEDSVAYIIPKDQQLLENKGALFIVADGMGGHAAGESSPAKLQLIRSARSTIRMQIQIFRSSIRRAIQYANATIYQRATENAQHSGMGTTCVAAVLRGSTAFIANVGR